MTADELRALRWAEPFVPVELELTNGDRLPCRDRLSWGVPPGSETLIYFPSEADHRMIPVTEVRAARPLAAAPTPA